MQEGAAVYDSARMTLEEVMDVVEQSHRAGLAVVRLHTGDPCLYGAIREQMDWMDRKGIPYDICPGVSSFCGAASALGMEYTLPDVTQSVVITRMVGRTAGAGEGIHTQLCSPWGFHGDIPEHGYAGGIVTGTDGRRIQEDTPAAIVYKATWPGERWCAVPWVRLRSLRSGKDKEDGADYRGG